MATLKRSYSTCSCCGKPLSDPISVSIGMGPICRVSSKTKSLNEKTENMFANRSKYSYEIDGYVVAIEDLGGMKSVTNDIEKVLSDIEKVENIDLSKYKIMYKDSMDVWDGITYENRRVSFFSVNEKNFYAAKTKLLSSK